MLDGGVGVWARARVDGNPHGEYTYVLMRERKGSPGFQFHPRRRTDHYFDLSPVGDTATFVIRARVKGYETVVVENVRLARGAIVGGIDLPCEAPAARLSGAVALPDGEPVVGAHVRIKAGVTVATRRFWPPVWATTDGNGVFAFDSVSSGVMRLAVLDALDAGGGSIQRVELGSAAGCNVGVAIASVSETRGLLLIVGRDARDRRSESGAGDAPGGFVVGGRVVDHRGRPRQGLTVQVHADRDSVPTSTTQTDEHGEFRATGLAPGRYTARVVSDDVYVTSHRVGQLVGGRDNPVAAVVTTADVDDILFEITPKIRVSGRILRPDGSPLIGELYELFREDYMPGEAGRGSGRSSGHTSDDGAWEHVDNDAGIFTFTVRAGSLEATRTVDAREPGTVVTGVLGTRALPGLSIQ